MRVLERLHIPRLLAALLLILALFGTIVGLGAAVSGPARTWAAKLPEGIPRLEERMSSCGCPSIHCNDFCSRWKILAEQDHQPMGPPRSEVQLF